MILVRSRHLPVEAKKAPVKRRPLPLSLPPPLSVGRDCQRGPPANLNPIDLLDRLPSFSMDLPTTLVAVLKR